MHRGELLPISPFETAGNSRPADNEDDQDIKGDEEEIIEMDTGHGEEAEIPRVVRDPKEAVAKGGGHA